MKNKKKLDFKDFENYEIKTLNPLVGGIEECEGTTTIHETSTFTHFDITIGGPPTGSDDWGSWDDECCC